MSRNAKIALAVIGGFAVVACLGIVIYPFYQFYQFATYDGTSLNSNPVSEGIGKDGQLFRQETAYFMSGEGLVKFTAMGSAENWNQAVIDEFLESIQ